MERRRDIVKLLCMKTDGKQKIDGFESFAKFTAGRDRKYQQLNTVHLYKEQIKTATELAYAEVSVTTERILRELQNESRQHNRTKRGQFNKNLIET